MNQVEPLFLTADQCAVRYNISLRHFKQLVAQGEMPKPLKFGRCARWPLISLEDFERNGIRKTTDFFDPAAHLRTKKKKKKR